MGSHQYRYPPGSGFPAQKPSGKFGGIGCTKWVVLLLGRGLHAQGCILPWLLRAEASPCTPQKRSVFPTQPPDQGVSAKKLTGKDGEVGDTECHAAPSSGYAASTKSLGGICLNPEKPTNPSTQLRNSQVRTEGCETQNPKHLLRAPASRP